MAASSSLIVQKEDFSKDKWVEETDEELLKKKKFRKPELPLLSFLTYFPVGNPLEKLNSMQRQFFFESLSKAVEVRQNEGARLSRLLDVSRPLSTYLPQTPQPAPWLSQKNQKSESVNFRENLPKVGDGKSSIKTNEAKTDLKFDSQPQQPDTILKSGELLSMGNLPSYSEPVNYFHGAKEALAAVIADYAREDSQKAQLAIDEFEKRVVHQNYHPADLMTVMLLVIEDQIWEGEEGAPGSSRHFGARVGAPKQILPGPLRQTAQDSAVVRLASVREMLRHYFLAHPKEYSTALAMALGITADREGDVEFLQERLAYELATIGSFALAQKLLAEIKELKKMDTEKCLLAIGYRYDKKTGTLVVGKRTCGSRDEARGLVNLLLSMVKK